MMVDDAQDLPAAFQNWLEQVDRIMMRDWYIDTDDAGIELERLLIHWQDGDSPEAYVSWFAEKYGLTDFKC